MFVGDFNTVRFLPNRIQGTTATDESTVFILDPSKLRLFFLTGYRAERLGKTGLSEKMQLSVDWTLGVTSEKACAAIYDVDETAAVTL